MYTIHQASNIYIYRNIVYYKYIVQKKKKIHTYIKGNEKLISQYLSRYYYLILHIFLNNWFKIFKNLFKNLSSVSIHSFYQINFSPFDR